MDEVSAPDKRFCSCSCSLGLAIIPKSIMQCLSRVMRILTYERRMCVFSSNLFRRRLSRIATGKSYLRNKFNLKLALLVPIHYIILSFKDA